MLYTATTAVATAPTMTRLKLWLSKLGNRIVLASATGLYHYQAQMTRPTAPERFFGPSQTTRLLPAARVGASGPLTPCCKLPANVPHRTCHKCGGVGRLLEASTAISIVDYYRCETCGHVWTHKKDDPHGPPRDVTVIPPRVKH